MTDRIAEIAELAAKRLELIASLTPDGMHFSDWYQRQRDELLWTNARLADTVPELLDALDAAAAQQATAEAALKQAELDLEARTAEKLEALEYLRQFTGAFEDSDFDSRNWANDWRERRRQAQQAAGDTEAEA